jgi:hypothetical protein
MAKVPRAIIIYSSGALSNRWFNSHIRLVCSTLNDKTKLQKLFTRDLQPSIPKASSHVEIQQTDHF